MSENARVDAFLNHDLSRRYAMQEARPKFNSVVEQLRQLFKGELESVDVTNPFITDPGTQYNRLRFNDFINDLNVMLSFSLPETTMVRVEGGVAKERIEKYTSNSVSGLVFIRHFDSEGSLPSQRYERQVEQ
jgi:hypothetical protein